MSRCGYRQCSSSGSWRWRCATGSSFSAKRCEGHNMLIYLTAAVTLFLFVYLFWALVRPEQF